MIEKSRAYSVFVAVLVALSSGSQALAQDVMLPDTNGNCKSSYLKYEGVCLSVTAIDNQGAKAVFDKMLLFKERNADLFKSRSSTEMCISSVDDENDDLIRLTDGSILEVSRGHLGYIGYRPDALLVGSGDSRSLWIGDSNEISVEVLRQPQQCTRPSSYPIEAAVNDETFVINGELFESQTYCLGWEEGDDVVFLEGSALGVCVTATLFNANRLKTCNVWCE